MLLQTKKKKRWMKNVILEIYSKGQRFMESKKEEKVNHSQKNLFLKE